MIAPCKDCKNRKFNCHSNCTEYNEFVKLNNEFKKIKHKEAEIISFKKERVSSASRTKNNQSVDKQRKKEKYELVGRV